MAFEPLQRSVNRLPIFLTLYSGTPEETDKKSILKDIFVNYFSMQTYLLDFSYQTLPNLNCCRKDFA